MFAKKPDFTIPETGISAVEKVKVGGIDQYLLLQGERKDNPILLFLHGGPSMPLPGVSSRGRDYTVATNTRELVKHYVVAFWDQRGTGKSYSAGIAPESMTLEQFVSDANDIVDLLSARFGQRKLYLAGHSFGTLIGLTLAKRYPEKFHSYTGLSQIVSWSENDKLSYVWALKEARRRKHKKALAELEAVGEPPYLEGLEQWGVLRKWQTRFQSLVYSDETIRHPGLVRVTMDMFRSKDYGLQDVVNSFYRGFKLVYAGPFLDALPSIDMADTVREIDIPVTFIHGRKDVHVHGELVRRYADNLEAKRGKRLIWVDHSSHLFHPIDTKQIESILIQEKSRTR
ncbi:alpha/beta hydrolase [Paenibacillus antri]|uniref:Alpha/beta hydrolase n=1 Tax=Paenibacillus antri TaxID=2582848 RepID=A0A5R9GK21_9BACL|nr:alpha/beta hydrolase [Paenibacillus antri]